MGKMLYVIFNLKTDIIWNINYYYNTSAAHHS